MESGPTSLPHLATAVMAWSNWTTVGKRRLSYSLYIITLGSFLPIVFRPVLLSF